MGASQLIYIIGMPVLAMVYTPAEIGRWAIVISISSILVVVAGLRLELAMPLARYKKEVDILQSICVIINGLSALVAGLLILAADAFFGFEEGQQLYFLVPFVTLVMSLLNTFTYKKLHGRRFQQIAVNKARVAGVTLVFQLLLFKFDSLGLLLGVLIGQGVGAFLMLEKTRFFRVSNYKYVLEKYKKFPRYSTFEGVFNVASIQIMPILLGWKFSDAHAGYFALVQKMLQQPISIIGASFGQVYMAEGAKHFSEGTISHYTKSFYELLLASGFLIVGSILLFCSDIFLLVFGDQWTDSALIIPSMAAVLLIQSITSPISPIITITKRIELGVLIQLLLLGSRVGVVLCSPDKIAFGALVDWFAVVSCMSYGAYLVICLKLSQLKPKMVALLTLRETLFFLPLLLLSLLGTEHYSQPFVLLAGIVVIALLSLRFYRNVLEHWRAD